MADNSLMLQCAWCNWYIKYEEPSVSGTTHVCCPVCGTYIKFKELNNDN